MEPKNDPVKDAAEGIQEQAVADAYDLTIDARGMTQPPAPKATK